MDNPERGDQPTRTDPPHAVNSKQGERGYSDDDGENDADEVAALTSPIHSMDPVVPRSLIAGQAGAAGLSIPLTAADVAAGLDTWTVEAWINLGAADTGTILERTAFVQTLTGIEAKAALKLYLDGGVPTVSVYAQGQTLTVWGPWREGGDQEMFLTVLAYFEDATGVDVEYGSSENYEQQAQIDALLGPNRLKVDWA